MSRYVLALDQGTTSSRALLFDERGRVVASDQHEFTQHFPQPGWVEDDPEEIWRSQLAAARGAPQQARASADDIAAIGIANQRETSLVWDRATGEPVYPAIVWRSRQTAAICDELRERGIEDDVALQLACQARLPDAGLAGDHHQPAATIPRTVERPAEPLEFSLPADERFDGHGGPDDNAVRKRARGEAGQFARPLWCPALTYRH